MLRRNNSTKLDRHKSTSSIHSKHEPYDPELARRQAHAAAKLAFNRALERSSADGGHSANGLQRSSNTVQHQKSLSHLQSSTIENDHGVRQQHSVRFAGPNAIPRRQSIGTRANPRTLEPQLSTMTLRPVAMTTNAPVPAAYRPPSRSSSLGKATNRAVVDNFYVGNAFDEYYTREDDVASTPSSYRRIRRSKSMFSPQKAPSIFYTNGTPDKPENSYNGVHSKSSNAAASTVSVSHFGLRAPKSMAFLRSNRGTVDGERNDEAVQMARDRFFQDTERQRLREQPSFLFRSKAQRQEKPFRRSVRSSSGDSYGMPSAKQNESLKDSGFKDAARRASKTIKSKLRRVFGRSKDEPVSVPNQQVDARETHVRRYNGDGSAPFEDFTDIPHPDETSLIRAANRAPSIRTANSNQQLRSLAGSIKSIKSQRSDHSDDKSRVTSWTSVGVNTITSQPTRAQVEREQQRLSIIEEVGTHIPSSSFTRSRIMSNGSSYPVAPKSSHTASHGSNPVQAGQVDSMRVYSALMKRIDENSPHARLEATHKAVVENYSLPSCTPPSRVSIDGSPNRSTPATIRHVLPEDCSADSKSHRSCSIDHQWVRADSISSAKAENMFGHTGTHVHQWQTADSLREARMRNSDDVFSPKNTVPQGRKPHVRVDISSSNKENVPPSDLAALRKSIASISALSHQESIGTSYQTVPESFGPTPQEIANRNEPIFQSTKGLRESRSTFFGGNHVTISRRMSPFRLAMTEIEYAPPASQISNQLYDHDTIRNPMYLGPPTLSANDARDESDSEMAYSESIYSRTTSGQAPAGATSAVSLQLSDEGVSKWPVPASNTGDVVILDQSVYRPAKSHSYRHRVTDSMGSVEWKKWMSSEVSKLEKGKENNANASYVNYALPTMPKSFRSGHLRESTQINDDDPEVIQTRNALVKQPLGPVPQGNLNMQNPPILKPILKKPSLVLVERKQQQTSNIPLPSRAPPAIPARSPLRAMPSKSSLRSVAAANVTRTPNSTSKISTTNGKTLLHKRNVSQNTLRSVKSAKGANISIKILETPAKLVKRNRPYSSNTTTPAVSPGEALYDSQYGSTSDFGVSRTPRDSKLLSSRQNLLHKKSKENEKDEGDIYSISGSGILDPVMGVSRGGDRSFEMGRSASVRSRSRERERMRVSISEEDAQAVGSKTMVDLFLSSRRKRIASTDASGDEDRGAAFL